MTQTLNVELRGLNLMSAQMYEAANNERGEREISRPN